MLTGAMVLSMVAVAMVAQVDPAAVTVAVAMGPHPGGRAMALVAMSLSSSSLVRLRVVALMGPRPAEAAQVMIRERRVTG